MFNFIVLFSLRLLPAFGLLGYNILAARLFHADDASNIFLGITAMYMLSFLGKAGLDIYVVRCMAKSENSIILQLLLETLVLSMTFCLVGCAINFYVWNQSVIFVFMCTLPQFCLLAVLSGYYRGIGRERSAMLFDSSIGFLIASFLVLVADLFIIEITPVVFAALFFISTTIVLMIILYKTIHRLPQSKYLPFIFLKSWHLSLSSILLYSIQWMPVLLISTVSSVGVVALTIAIRIASPLSFIIATIDVVSARKIAFLFYQKKYSELGGYITSIKMKARLVALLIALIAYPVISFIFTLTLPNSESYLPTIAYIVVLTYCAKLIIGPANNILLMIHQEKIANMINFVVLSSSTILCASVLIFSADIKYILIGVAIIMLFTVSIGDSIMSIYGQRKIQST